MRRTSYIGSANIPRGANPLQRSLAASLDSLRVAAGNIVVIPAKDLSWKSSVKPFVAT